MLGDFIHSMAAIKNICEREQAKANIYISDNIRVFGGDYWKLSIEKTFYDLYELIKEQPFVNKFEICDYVFNKPYININNWRIHIARTHASQRYYSESWSEILSSAFNYKMPTEYKWLTYDKADSNTKNKIVIHRSLHRHNPSFDWIKVLEQIKEEVLFLTSSEAEWLNFPYKHYDNITPKIVDTVSEMASCINGCKFFIGNQSAPFALASALDIPRLVELDIEPSPFYMPESKYSENISWYLNEISNHFSKNSLIKF